ncbi:MAG TPA: hypothetical protein VF530_01180 [Planctomycetota bacterium]
MGAFVLVLALGLAACAPGGSSDDGPPPETPHPILFVTQVPVVADFTTIASTFGTHNPSPYAAPRGGDLWIRYEDGTLRNLTLEAGYGTSEVFQGANAIAVREPCVHWSATKAVFSMIVGAPTSGGEGNYRWQLYEVTGLGREDTAVITRVALQPANYNNVSPAYASDGRILFTSDRPRNGAAHLHPQLDEYEEATTNTGIWSLDPVAGTLFLMNHAPSGVFKPIVDRFGRVVFTRWDHLERDQQADQDRMGFSNYGTFNWSDESPGAVNTGADPEVFPEPRKQWIDFVNSTPGYGGDLAGWEPHLVGNRFNHFQLWMLNQDGTAEETLNHVGRHELFDYFERMRKDDPNVVDHVGFDPWVANRRQIGSFHQVRESRTVPGLYVGTDCREFDTHSSGQLVALAGTPTTNPNDMVVTWLTHPDTRDPTSTPSANHSGLYRSPLPLADGTLIAAHTANTRKEQNLGTSSMPRSRFDFRLKVLVQGSNGYYRAGQALTRGIRERVQYYDPFQLDTFDGNLWELDPVEVVARPVPPATVEAPLETPERDALTAEGVQPGTLRQWLRANDLALIVSRNVTSRDPNDRQQPLNLRIPGGVQSLAGAGRVYDVAYLRIFQGDLIRGLVNGIFGTQGGRRVLAQPLHTPAAVNPPNPGGPSGSVTLGPDGSMAALVPARRAVSWQLTAPDGTPVVNERYWISFQPGEIRTCANCHGQNELDQVGRPTPTNSPQALRTLLQHLKAQGHL